MRLVIGFIGALLVAAISIPVILRFAHDRKLYDSIDDRKIHSGNIPRLGGIGIFFGFILSVAVTTFVTGLGFATGGRFWAILVSMLLIFLLGLADDFVDIKARYKFVLELGTSLLLVVLGFRFISITLPLGLGTVAFGAAAYPLTILWIIGITNAINLIDGMDGLAGGIAAFTAATYGFFFMAGGDVGAAVACFALLGAIIGFLVYNLPPAKIFMGDSGALFLGFSIAVLPLIGPASGRIEIGYVPAVTILLIPIYDTFAAMIRRIRQGKSIFHPDRRHLHHKLLALGLSTKSALAVIYCAQVALCAVAVSRLIFPGQLGFYLNLGSWVALLALFLLLDRVAKYKIVDSEEDFGAQEGGERPKTRRSALKAAAIGKTKSSRRPTRR
jgi:UDP-GlcNAc:undecaprenyl-phosphate/decaprenyl-phosphate GlcNAc-1-phosphate transferase